VTDLQKQTVFFAIVAAILYLILFVFFDRTIDLWVHHHWADTWVFTSSKYVSCLAKNSFIWIGIALGLIVVVASDLRATKPWSKILLYVCVSAAIAMVIGEGLKYFLGRYRPSMLFMQDLYGFYFFSGKWELNSSPSGHTIRAFSILTALSLIYRRFTPVFISIAVLIGASRVLVTDHYPSDVLFGAYIGIFTSLWTYVYFFKKDPFAASGIAARERKYPTEK
jgi:membrane-associated phospholipid phosphatase